MRHFTIALTLMAVTLSGCNGCWHTAPYQVEKYYDVQPNHTVYFMPLEGQAEAIKATPDQTQQKLNEAEEKLSPEQKKLLQEYRAKRVFAKRYNIATRSRSLSAASGVTGNIEYIDTVSVIDIDRSPVSRTWTASKTTGTSPTNQALAFESKDSVNFSMCATMQCHVEDEDSYLYRLFYSTKSLSEIADSDIRGCFIAIGSEEFKKYEASECEANKVEVADEMFKQATAQMKMMGITIDFFGPMGGITYDKSGNQDQIDKRFIAEIDALTETERNKAQTIRNRITVARATAESKAAEALMTVREAAQQKVWLDAMLSEEKSANVAAGKWNGKLPSNMMPADCEIFPLFIGRNISIMPGPSGADHKPAPLPALPSKPEAITPKK